MFLKNITINNFKSIKKASVSFENGLNILIGKNGAGKSNLLQFIYQRVYYPTIAGWLFSNVNHEYQFIISYRKQNVSNELIVYIKREKVILKEEVRYLIEIRFSEIENGKFLSKEKSISYNEYEGDVMSNNELNDFLKGISLLNNFKRTIVDFEIPNKPYWLGLPNKYEIEIDTIIASDKHQGVLGIIFLLSNLINIRFLKQKFILKSNLDLKFVVEIFQMSFQDFIEKYQLNHYLPKYSPIQEIRINPNINIYKTDDKILVENLLIDFKVNDNWVPWSYLSDGAKRLFYLITQCLSIDDGLVLIEEPELGIHPHQLYGLMEFIKEQSADKQIIISTHSPIVLDILSPDELNRINIVKLTEEGTQFYKLDEEQINTAKKYMNEVGELSYYWLHSDLENE